MATSKKKAAVRKKANTVLYTKRIGSVYCTVLVSDIKLLVLGIAFFALIRFKYSTLTHAIRSPDGVVGSMLACNAQGWDIDSRITRSLKTALESYFASHSLCFYKILLIELGFGQRCQPER